MPNFPWGFEVGATWCAFVPYDWVAARQDPTMRPCAVAEATNLVHVGGLRLAFFTPRVRYRTFVCYESMRFALKI